jgi:hypothetical protein
MQMVKVSQEAEHMNECCKENHEMQNLMASAKNVKDSSPEPFRELYQWS